MLHEDVLMADIDVDQWRNAQALLLRSAKQSRRLVVIHDDGRVLKFRHTDGLPVQGRPKVVEDPHRLAKELYEANHHLVDFVVVLERDAVDSYFAQVQDSWDIDSDLDDFVRRTYAALDSFTEGIVTHPRPARSTLGLQWHIGASFEELHAGITTYVIPRSTVILGVESDGELWTSLILDFDEDHRINSVTTADPSMIDIHGRPADLLRTLTSWVESSGKVVSLALVLSYNAATALLAAPATQKGTTLKNALARKHAALGRVPAALQ